MFALVLPRNTALVNAQAVFARPDPGGTNARFHRWSAEDLHNEHLGARDRLRHTRASRVAHKLVARGLEALRDVPRDRIGVVTASVYAGTAETQATRIAQARPGPGIDPVQFSRATHSYVAAVLASGFVLRGPTTSLVGRVTAAREALRHAGALLSDGAADAMLVVAFDELGDLACRHLEATRPAGMQFAEACAVLALRPGMAGAESRAGHVARPAADAIDYLACEPLRAIFEFDEVHA